MNDRVSLSLLLSLLASSGACAATSRDTAPRRDLVARPDPAPLAVTDAPSGREVTPAEGVAPSTTVMNVAAPAHPSCAGEKGDECHGESCCTRIAMPAGDYPDAKAGKVHVAAFSLDKYEVTVGRVRAWNQAGAKAPSVGEIVGHSSAGRPIVWQASWSVQRDDGLRGWERYDTWTANDPQLPKNFINWYTATAFCRAEGGRLPTDAEWHYAAVGGEEDRAFPWGSEPQTPERAVYNCMGDGDQSCSLADILEVGSRPLGQGRWGHMDLVGSMFEWTSDAGADGESIVAKGGGFCYIGGVDRRVRRPKTADNDRRDAPTTVSQMVGLRCAFDAPEASGVALR